MTTRLAALLLAGILACVATPPAHAQQPAAQHAIAMHGAPALPKDFPHLPYADPNAPKGGRLTLGMQGSFETLNPFAVRSIPVRGMVPNVIESLMARSYDEPFTLYGLIAESIVVPEDRSSVEFRINPKARFSDGKEITAQDVLFTWQLLRDKGTPNQRSYYSKVKAATAPTPLSVRFDLSGSNDRELPLILGLMPVLPKHATDVENFEQMGFTALMGSGPYLVGDVRPGEGITYKRNPNYWGADLPINRGMNNADELRYDYFRDANTLFEAFKKGLYDIRMEGDPTRWLTGYDIPAVREGRLLKESFRMGIPKGMNAFVFNTRKPIFQDVRVREALGYLFDFEWANTNLFHGVYSRTGSYYEGSELSARGVPASAAENKLLAPFPNAVRKDVLAGTWQPPQTDGSGRDRTSLRKALELLREAGWQLSEGVLRKDGTGEPFAFEILINTKEQERIALAYSRWLERAGIKTQLRLVDNTQFQRRLGTYDYDMTMYFWLSTISPGNEQYRYWSSQVADAEGSRNYMGMKNPAADAMIAALLAANTREELVTAVRALDRILISGFYVVPLYHLPEQWAARWSHVGHPARSSLFGPVLESWWREKDK